MASVVCQGQEVARIGHGLVVLACVEVGDAAAQRDWMAEKLVHLRVFADETGKMNRSLIDVGGAMLLVSNFTVAGDCRSGRRPGFDRAMKPPRAKGEFDLLLEAVAARGVRVETGVFGGDMEVTIVNDGPVTLIVESPPEPSPAG
jgi:D-tyrosyl-tRNA(Tyr) deacylase